MEKSFAENLVAEFYQLAIKSTYSKEAAEAFQIAKRDLIQALTVPARTEEDDFLTVWDSYAIAALQGLCVEGGKINDLALSAGKIADAAMIVRSERAKRAAQEGGPA